MPRGRPPSIESQRIVDVILEQSDTIIISKGGQIVDKNNLIWETIAAKLNYLIKPFSLYSYVTDNRYNIKQKLFERHNINLDLSLDSTRPTIVEKSMDSSDASNLSFHENIKRSYVIYFTKEEFNDLIITKYRQCVSGKGRKKIISYKALKPGIWEDTINDKLIESTNITCGLSFKNHYISIEESSGTFSGHCRCGSKLDGLITNKLNEELVEIRCNITKGSGICGKRWLKGPRREAAVQNMGNKTTHTYRAEKADREMSHGDYEPPNLPSSPVLRGARHQYRKKNFLHADPIRALQILKHTEAAFVIRHIGLDPFYVHYWSRHQLNIYRDYVLKGHSCLCIDATGKIVKKMKKCNEIKTKSIYLYHGVIRINEGQFPVTQMISESHNANSLHFWLMEWVRSGAPFPKEVVVDGSRAILTAAVRAFTNHATINEYENACYDFNFPSCYIRIDNAHFLNTYVKLLKSIPSRVSIFYKASIGQLIIAKTRDKAKKIIKALLLISQSETDGNLPNGLPTKVEEANKYLKSLITADEPQTEAFKYESDTINEDSEESMNNDSASKNDESKNQPKLKKNKEINQWSNLGYEINETVALIISTEIGDRVNAHFLPTFAQKLLSDLCDLPLWSSVVRDDFGFGRIPASSACVESEFNKTKNLFLKNEVLPMRVDEYVRKYVNYINGRIKIIASKIAQTVDIQNEGKEERNEYYISSEKSLNFLGRSPDLDDVPKYPTCFENKTSNGRHTCFICHTPFNILDACDNPFDIKDNEEFQQKPICIKCQEQDNISVILACHHKENWSNKTENTSITVKNQIKKVKDAITKDRETLTDKKKAKYFGEKPHLINEQLQFHGKYKKIVLLKNGSNDSLRPVMINGRRVNAILTCAFDSVYQVIAAAVCDWPTFRYSVKNNNESNQIFKLAIDLFEDLTSFSAAYEIRARLHYNFVERIEQPDGSILLCCETSVMNIILRTFGSTPSCTVLIKCSQCTKQEQKNIIAPIACINNIMHGHLDITKLPDLCLISRCRSAHCKGELKTCISELGNMVIFEIFNAGGDCIMKLEDLPRHFVNPLEPNNNYRIVGAVAYEYLGNISSTHKSGGHFVAMCLRGTEWYEYDDTKTSEKLKKGKTKINIQVLVYVKI